MHLLLPFRLELWYIRGIAVAKRFLVGDALSSRGNAQVGLGASDASTANRRFQALAEERLFGGGNFPLLMVAHSAMQKIGFIQNPIDI